MNVRIAALLLALTAPLPVSAAGIDRPAVRTPLPHLALPRQPRGIPSANSGWPHRYFGTLVSVNGSIVTIQLRNGRLLQTDATQAFTLGRYSAPLYPGKPTVVYGAFATNGQFFASIVKRAAPRAESWGGDQ